MQRVAPPRTICLVLLILNLITEGTENFSLGNKATQSLKCLETGGSGCFQKERA